MTTATKTSEPLLTVRLETPPVPAARPRVGRWGTYYPPRYKRWMLQAGEEAATLLAGTPTLEGPVRVYIVQVVGKAKTSKRAWPQGDVDNYAKGPLDILVKQGFLKDDDLVLSLKIDKRYARPGETPHTYITIYGVQPDDDGTDDLEDL